MRQSQRLDSLRRRARAYRIVELRRAELIDAERLLVQAGPNAPADLKKYARRKIGTLKRSLQQWEARAAL